MQDSARRRAGTTVAAILLADAAAHVYWLTGATWPASNVRDLSLALLGAEFPFTPRVLIPLAVALCVGAASALVLSRRSGPRWVRIPALLVTATVCAATGARAILGVIWIAGIGIAGNDVLFWLNLVLYTPLCLVLMVSSGLLAVDAFRETRARDESRRRVIG
ncbi:DUF3995 domain-containing protein [Agromyces laixinhei]|uniref:DUF3995 domain-containing protein n=1 Tax=Agromyces laixinhei TaxID=2585717 RepID=UPI0011165975|nr:DUF3995 domain-containing protein [Agromyces laixinhei]